MGDPMFNSPRPTNSMNFNINDIIEVIGDDLAATGSPMRVSPMRGYPQEEGSEYSTITSTSTSTVAALQGIRDRVFARIIEQPQPKALRFRYICEGRSAGSIPGVRSTNENKTFPSIQVMGYSGSGIVVVSCVTVDPPYRPHPHNLVGKEGCKQGVCTMALNTDGMTCVFSNLGIQCVKRKDVDEALREREKIRVDPFGTGFSHRAQPQSIDLNALRLCFQVFLDNGKGKFSRGVLTPIVSDPIYDKKATCDLLITKLSSCTSSVAGGKEIILLCDKVTKEDIQVRVFEVRDGAVSWEALADFQPSDVHKQVAIAFRTPPYHTLELENPVKVQLQLVRPSDKSRSEALPFEYLPLDAGTSLRSYKRLKHDYAPFCRILGLSAGLKGIEAGPQGLGEGLEGLGPAHTRKRKISPSLLSSSRTSGGVITIYDDDEQTRHDATTDVKMRVSAAVRRRTGNVSASNGNGVDNMNSGKNSSHTNNNNTINNTNNNNTNTNNNINSYSMSPAWPDSATLDDMLSDTSVSELLSACGGGVYQDIADHAKYSTGVLLSGLNTSGGSVVVNTANTNNSNASIHLNNAANAVQHPPHAMKPCHDSQLDALLSLGFPAPPDTTLDNSLQLPGDALYGDASYASCYSNLEFVLNSRPRAVLPNPTGHSVTNPSGQLLNQSATNPSAQAMTVNSHSPMRGSMFPAIQRHEDMPEDEGLYGTPSNIPVHATKTALLQCRGFVSGRNTGIEDISLVSPRNHTINAAMLPLKTEQEDDLELIYANESGLPTTVLDLFV